MTISTPVERGRVRARFATLSVSTILCSGLAAPAFAQTAPPPYVDVDGNGVDLVSGNYVTTLTEGTIGSGDGAVSVQRTRNGAANWVDNWSGGLMFQTVGSTTTAYVFQGAVADTFSVSGSTYTSLKGDGATLVATTIGLTPGYLYTAADGTKVSYISQGNKKPALGLPLSGFACASYSNLSCAIPVSIVKPNGMTFTLNWTFAALASTAYYRFAGVSSSAGYGFTINYVTDTAGTSGAPQTNWYNKTNITFSNTNNPPASPPVVTYPTPSTDYPDFNDPAGRAWHFGAGIGTPLTSIQRPGASSASTTISYSGTPSYVSSITIDGVTTNYSRVVGGSTATTTITDAYSNQTIAQADLTVGRVTKLTEVRAAGNRVTNFTYDTSGRLTEVAYPEGNKVQYAYDARGNVTATTLKAKPSVGGTDIVTTASFDTTCTNVVKCNKPNSTTDAKTNQTDYAYDTTTGQITSVTAPAATTGANRPQTRYSYTATGGVSMLTGISQCQTGVAPSCVGTADEAKTSIGYNTNLLPTSVTKSAGDNSVTATTAATYDAIGNLLTVDGPLTGTDDTTTYRYNADRERVGAISPDPDGAGALKRRAVRTTYNNDGQPTLTEIGTVNGTTDTDWAAFVSIQQQATTYDANARKTTDTIAAGGTTYALTQYSYDSDGRLDCSAVRMKPGTYTSLPASACTATTGSGDADRITKMAYDNAGRPTKTTSAYGTSDASDDASATYTDNGQVATLTDAENNKTSYTYDGFDRLSKTNYPSTTKGSGTSSATDYEQLTYDANGNVTNKRARDGIPIAFGIDNLNRVTSRTENGSLTRQYGYNLLGQLTSSSWPSGGSPETLTYDALGRLTSRTEPYTTLNYQYDAAGRRTRVTWPDGLYISYNYDLLNEMTTVLENGSTTLATYGYDDLGRRTSLTRGNGTASYYSYDGASRLTCLRLDLAGGGTLDCNPTASGQDNAITFGYNPAGQIISRVTANAAYAWTGSVTVNRPYTTNGLNQYTASGSTSLSYDGRGNLNTSGSSTYGYDALNHLVSTNGAASSLEYGSLDELQGYNLSSSYPRFASDGGNIVGEYLWGSPSTLQRRYVYGASTDEPLVWYEGTGTSDKRWLIPDERGSVVAVTNASGASIATNAYDEYGIPGASNLGRFQYTGQAWLPEVGLYYYKARMYSPTLGRFMQTDPIGYGDGMNWYNYVSGDPINFFDPSGMKQIIVEDCSNKYHGPATNDGNTITVVQNKCVRSILEVSDSGGVGAGVLGPRAADKDNCALRAHDGLCIYRRDSNGSLVETEEWKKHACANAGKIQQAASSINDSVGFPGTSAAEGAAGAAAARKIGATAKGAARAGGAVTLYGWFVGLTAQVTSGQGWQPFGTQVIPKADLSMCSKY